MKLIIILFLIAMILPIILKAEELEELNLESNDPLLVQIN